MTLADGREVPIGDLVESALAVDAEALDDGFQTTANPDAIEVLSLDPVTLRLEPRPVLAFVKRTSPERLVRVRTRSGRRIEATPYHPLFTLRDGQLDALRADELRIGTRVAVPRWLPTRQLEYAGHHLGFVGAKQRRLIARDPMVASKPSSMSSRAPSATP